MRSVLLVTVLSLGMALARGRGGETALEEKGPASSAAEIPALDQLLMKGGWTPTPEMSGRYEVGTILDTSMGDHRIMARNCFARPPVVSPYIGAEIVGSMQAGVAVKGGFVEAGGGASIVKKVKFGTPTTASLERLYMKMSNECLGLFKDVDPAWLKNMYIVQEVLKAEISEQTCGRVSASGRFMTLGSADAEYAQACAQESLEPVAVGYRTLPLVEVLPAELRAKVLAVGQSPAPPIPAPVASTVAAQAEVDPDSESDASEFSTSEYSGSHFGAYLGALSGVRYQWRGASGRRAVGLRAEAGIFLGSFLSPVAGAQGAIEYERRRSPDSPVAALFSLVAGYPIYFGGGAGVVFGKPTGLRGELGAMIGAYGLATQANAGWVW